jgi:predicted metal-dependent phosphotriesterase family hydrolase
MAIMTVRGPISAQQAGPILSHEHVLCDLWPFTRSYDGILDDEELAVQELLAFARAAGGGTLVDATSFGLGRNPRALRRISQESGVHIVMGAAWYREEVYPRLVWELSTNDLADRIVEELTVGVDGTDIRAGMIGEIGTERNHISPAQERVFRAAARAHTRTNAAILTHTTHFGELAVEQIALLAEERVRPDRIVISHLGDRPGRNEMLLAIARTGVYLSIDNVGWLGSGYPDDSVRVRNIRTLIDEGHLNQILLSGDICMKSHLRAYGGKGYDHVQSSFLPLLAASGVTPEQIQRMTVVNPWSAYDMLHTAAAEDSSGVLSVRAH